MPIRVYRVDDWLLPTAVRVLRDLVTELVHALRGLAS